MPKLTYISSRNAIDAISVPKNNKFLNKTATKRKILFVSIYGKLQWMKSSTYFDVLNANSAKIRI